jgi:hypothetical protein
MKARGRRKIDMGERASEFSHANPGPSPGFTALLGRLDDLLMDAKRLGVQQLEGIALSRGATAVKRSLELEIRRNHLGHLAGVAQVAAVAAGGRAGDPPAAGAERAGLPHDGEHHRRRGAGQPGPAAQARDGRAGLGQPGRHAGEV